MTVYNVNRTICPQGEITDKVAAYMRMFGLSAQQVRQVRRSYSCEVEINRGDIVFISGPSGCGKSVILKELERSVPVPERVNLDEITLPGDRAVIDCFEGDLLGALKLLSIAGLTDVICIVNEPAHLSEGQQWRFRLAMALASGRGFVFADEFCCGLDRVTACVIAYNIHKFAKRTGVTFVAAASRDDLLADLEPDVLVLQELSGATRVIYKSKPR